MQALDLRCDSSLNPRPTDPAIMLEQTHSLNHNTSKSPEDEEEEAHMASFPIGEGEGANTITHSTVVLRRDRPSRACTQRAVARMQAAVDAEAAVSEAEKRKKKAKRRERLTARLLKDEFELDVNEEFQEEEYEVSGENSEASGSNSLLRLQRSKIITPLVGEPEASQLPRWRIRSMWQLASILNFFNVFRALLNIKAEFSAEELETALITPNKTLADVHMPLLKAIPPVTRMAFGHATWITVLCRKLRDWWHWVSEGDLPIVASHGTEFELYNNLDPGVRVVILKALCDIRVEQEDIRNYIDVSLKHGARMSRFRKERIGGDSHGISYWYEDDPIVGHRLYREIRKIEVQKGEGKSIPPIPSSSYQWETVATNLEEFENVSEKLFTSENRTEVSAGKKLKNNMLSEITKVHKRKEKLVNKQHRQALMLDSIMSFDVFTAGRSLRDRKHVTYTFDEYDRSINEAINVTMKRTVSPDSFDEKDSSLKFESSRNDASASPKSPELYESEMLDRSNRQRRRPQRYSVNEFVEGVSDNDVEFDSDEDIVGEVVYDDEYLKKRKQRRKISSSSEGDEEYHFDEETYEEEDEHEEEEEYENSSTSEESKSTMSRTRRETKVNYVGEMLHPVLRRSKRATGNRIDYKKYEASDSDSGSMKLKKTYESDRSESSKESKDRDEKSGRIREAPETRQNDRIGEEFRDKKDFDGVRKRGFLDLNEVAVSDDNRDDL